MSPLVIIIIIVAVPVVLSFVAICFFVAGGRYDDAEALSRERLYDKEGE